MASTRNKNTQCNYNLEQKQNRQFELYNTQYGTSYNTEFAGNGFMPGKLPREYLSQNSVDIESFLFGINSTNLVNPKTDDFVPKINYLETANIYEKPVIYIPEPLVVEKNQRPFPISK